ncbi:MAG: dehydrogenase [Planctomycetes bacterium]|nr:dehydrogenase [Planctomycetota bacterium]
MITRPIHCWWLPLAICACASSPHQESEYWLRTFRRQRLSETFFSEGATFADLDRDGHNDIVSGPYWYEGPRLTERHEIYEPVPADPLAYSDSFFAFVHDFDEDGWLDVLEIGFPGRQARWYENPGGEERRWTRHIAFEGVDNEAPGFGDVTGDGKPELFFHTGGRFGWAGPAPGRAEEPWEFHALSEDLGLSNFVHGLGFGDLNGDDRPDLLEKNGWWRQPAVVEEGLIWQHYPVPFSAGRRGGAQMFAYDVDGDGDNDVITSLNGHGWGLSWFEQVQRFGSIEFLEHRIMDSRPDHNRHGVAFSQLHALALADVNGDGLADIVTGKRHWAHGPEVDPGSRDPAVVYWFELTRDGGRAEYIPHLVDDDTGVGVQVVAGDVDGDGLIDVVVGNKKGTTVLFQQARRVSEEEWRAARPAPRHPGGVVPRAADGSALNLGFEAGTLEHWTATGDAFEGQPVRGDTLAPRGLDEGTRHAGEYWIGGYELHGDGRGGSLTSGAFVASHPYASFLAGGGHHAATRVDVIADEDGAVLFSVSGANREPLQRCVVDLREQRGELLRVRISDEHTGGWGHVNFDDFLFHAERPRFARDADLARLIERVPTEHSGLPAEAAAEAMTVPAGFTVDLIAAEPDLHQPIALAIDERGRLWVAEALSYPERRPSQEGRDAIVVFEDADTDGWFERRTVFAEGLNLVSGLQVGFGGVWVGAAPQLLFIPDIDGDLVPDGEPRVLLDGWGYEDTHETLNTFTWGPDGWLYGCHGVFTHSRVGVPGSADDERTPLNAGVWRYHPTRHEFEVFAWGTSNPWGIDFDSRGQAFLTACVIPHLFHVAQGGRYQRQAGEHFNPHVYQDIQTIADHLHYAGNIRDHAWWGREEPEHGRGTKEAGGGHAHCGAMIYLGGSFPDRFDGTIFFSNIHGNRFNNDRTERSGSGFVGRHGEDFLLANDEWFRGIGLETGPDGAVYFIDWYDEAACHRTDIERWDRTNGRLYRVRYGELTPRPAAVATLDDAGLLEALRDENEWFSRQARRVWQERGAPLSGFVRHELGELLAAGSPRDRLRALWALHVTGSLTEQDALALLADEEQDEFVRAWAVQLMLEDRVLESGSLEALERAARGDPSPVVRLYLAAGLQRMPLEQRWGVARGLASHAEDADDQNLPLMLWYGLEPLAAEDSARALALAGDASLDLPAAFLARRVAAEPGGHAALVGAMAETRDEAWFALLLGQLAGALEGERGATMPSGWRAVGERASRSDDGEVRDWAFAVAVAFGDASVFPELRGLLADGEEPVERRGRAAAALIRGRDAEAAGVMHAVLAEGVLRGSILRGLAHFDHPRTPQVILAHYSSLDEAEKRDALHTLAARSSYARSLLRAVEEGVVAADELDAVLLRQLGSLDDEQVEELLVRVWGVSRETPQDRLAQIAEWMERLDEGKLAQADLSRGREVYSRTCESCHVLFGEGRPVGPELTGSNRADKEYILTNIIDPNALIPSEYQITTVQLEDERVVSGILTRETPTALTLETQTETIVVAAGEVVLRVAARVSMMPEGQLDALDGDEVRDLVAYLASDTQVPLLATQRNRSRFFDGESLAGWRGNPAVWSVEGGEIVGRTDGLAQNEFLKSDLLLEDFRLIVDVRLVGDAGNSGIQFRSETLEGGDVRGYQADIGPGWWGKLYEEHGRALLVATEGDGFIEADGWNTYEILAVGQRVRTVINGQACVDLEDPDGVPRGIVALQVHSGGPTEVRFRNPRLELDPDPELVTLER